MANKLNAWKILSFLLISAGLSIPRQGLTAFPTAHVTPPHSNAPVGLTCEAMTEPLGIGNTQPRLSWRLTDARRGARQTAYEIRVASSTKGLSRSPADVWDSGPMESSESVNVVYSGPALVSGRRYYWQVRVWDQENKPTAYSKPSWWEMGLLSPEDWKAKWIARDVPVVRGDYESGAKWIWATDEGGPTNGSEGKRAFRFTFILDREPKDAALLITGNNNVVAWVNGKRVLEASPATGYGTRDPWGHFRVVPLGQTLQKGTNVLAAEVPLPRGSASEGGLIALLRVHVTNSKILRFVSSPAWKTVKDPKDDNWYAKDFDDSTWPNAAVNADMGQGTLGFPWPPEAASLLRKSFPVEKAVRKARIYATALGSYQLYLNGQRVGNDALAPGWTDYRKRIVYQAYDITSQLRKGPNTIGAILGDGWYASGLTWLQTRYNFGPPPVRLIAQLEVEYEDGAHELVATDESWKAAESPIQYSELYNGEYYDAQREQSEWDTPSFSDVQWQKVTVEPAPSAPLAAQDFQPIRIEKSLGAKAVTNPKVGVYIFDLGQNMVGWGRLRVEGPRGTKVRLRFSEVLKPSGELYTENNRTAAVTDTYVLRGKGKEVFEPHFTFHGFRYVEVTGYPGVPPLSAVEGVVFHTDAPFTIQFRTANQTVNQLWNNILWGQRGNFLSVPTDCPQRDERLGWMGDAEVFWRTATFNANLAAFSHKFATDMRDAQSPSGAYADVSPRVGPVSQSVAGWADAGVIIPWTAYLQYRDKRILEENWASMEKWMEHLESSNPNYLWLKERGNDYADWLAIGSETPKDLIATAYWAYDASLMKRIAIALGRNSDRDKYDQLFEKIRTAFDQAYVKPDGTVGSGSQTSYVLALHMCLLPEGQRPDAAQRLVDDIKAHDWHLTTGFLGTPYLLIELSNSGHSDVAYRLLLQKTYPSWGYMIEHGASTMWERWNGDQKLDDPSMNSFNHYAYGAVAEWLYRYAAGIDEDPEDPGFHRILLHPQFNSELGQVEATYESPYGPIRSQWKVTGHVITWNVVVPANTEALLLFPGDPKMQILENGKDIQQSVGVKFLRKEGGKSIYEAGSGSYAFSFGQTP